MMTSSNGNLFHVTGPLWREFTSDRWIPLTKASDAEPWCFLWSAPEQTVEQTIETPLIWDGDLRHHRNVMFAWISAVNWPSSAFELTLFPLQWITLLNLVLHMNILLLIFLTHWGRVTHICVSELTIIDSDNGLLPGRCQAIIWSNAGIILVGPLWTNFSENAIKIDTFSLKKMHLKRSSEYGSHFVLASICQI